MFCHHKRYSVLLIGGGYYILVLYFFIDMYSNLFLIGSHVFFINLFFGLLIFFALFFDRIYSYNYYISMGSGFVVGHIISIISHLLSVIFTAPDGLSRFLNLFTVVDFVDVFMDVFVINLITGCWLIGILFFLTLHICMRFGKIYY